MLADEIEYFLISWGYIDNRIRGNTLLDTVIYVFWTKSKCHSNEQEVDTVFH